MPKLTKEVPVPVLLSTVLWCSLGMCMRTPGLNTCTHKYTNVYTIPSLPSSPKKYTGKTAGYEHMKPSYDRAFVKPCIRAGRVSQQPDLSNEDWRVENPMHRELNN